MSLIAVTGAWTKRQWLNSQRPSRRLPTRASPWNAVPAGDLLDLQVALAPCVLGYAEIGKALAERRSADNLYEPWIASYAGAEYQQAAQGAADALERIGARSGAEARMPDLQAAFNTAVMLETAFWDMGWRAGRD